MKIMKDISKPHSDLKRDYAPEFENHIRFILGDQVLRLTTNAPVEFVQRGTPFLVDRPYAYFARAAQWFAALSAPPRVPGVHATAAIDPAARGCARLRAEDTARLRLFPRYLG